MTGRYEYDLEPAICLTASCLTSRTSKKSGIARKQLADLSLIEMELRHRSSFMIKESDWTRTFTARFDFTEHRSNILGKEARSPVMSPIRPRAQDQLLTAFCESITEYLNAAFHEAVPHLRVPERLE
jgi:hypothetical protein